MFSVLLPWSSNPGSSTSRVFSSRHSTLRVPLSTQEYIWVLVHRWKNLTNCREVAWNGLASRPKVAEMLLAATCYRTETGINSSSYEPVGSTASLFYYSSSTLYDNMSLWSQESIDHLYWLAIINNIIVLVGNSLQSNAYIAYQQPACSTTCLWPKQCKFCFT